MENCSYSGTVEELSGNVRLDCYAAETLGLHRAQIKSRLLEAKLNGRAVKLSRPVKTGDRIELFLLPNAPVYLKPEPIPLDLIYEDDHCTVINKAQGMVVHPGAGNHTGTLANALLWRRLGRQTAGQRDLTDSFNDDVSTMHSSPDHRSGIVHRLDKDTSGVIIAAYDNETLEALSAQFRAGTVRKHYLAIVQGTPKETEGRIFTRLIRDPRDRKRFAAVPAEKRSSSIVSASTGKGKLALTRYRILKSWESHALILLKPKTGRTHQLRVQLKYIGHPILGDPIYSPQYEPGRILGAKNFPGASLMLHASSLAIVLPGEREHRCFTAPLPDRFKTIIAALKRRP
ncbi:MAG: RluA family pseudouridine synthase [Treponema sp.]|nr:RluA family pseudouridine synthase [Treponema sp.]